MIDASFSVVEVVQWDGPTAGLQIPTTRLAMSNPSWQPAEYGEGVLACQLKDGEIPLGSAEINVGRDGRSQSCQLYSLVIYESRSGLKSINISVSMID